jgi:DNA replication protein DnaC
MTQNIDGARLTLMLNDLRLPAIKQDWSGFAERADRESWPAARFLATLAEHEIAERDRRRLARHLAEAQLLPGKTLDSFDFNVVPMISKARVLAICAGDSWIDKGANLLLIGGPGGGKSHLASAIGLALVENGRRVMFSRTSSPIWFRGCSWRVASWRWRRPSIGLIASIS